MLLLQGTFSPSQQAKIRRLSRPQEHDPSETGGELNIVPFLDIIMNVLMFVLATIPAIFTSTLDVTAARVPRPGTLHEPRTLGLSMVLTAGGVSFKTSAYHVGPGCQAHQQGFSVAARSDGSIPWEEVRACAIKIKEANPEHRDERDITLLADPGIPHGMLIRAMDAVRRGGDRPLFDQVSLGVPR
jgi:biopolymer transport protein ExbD